MRRRLFFVLFVLLFSSCKEDFTIVDKLFSLDKSLAMVLDYSLLNNNTFTIRYSETVEIIDIKYDVEEINNHSIGSIFTFTLPYEIKRGENKIFSISARKQNGNITRSSFLLVGRNPDIPNVLINEVSIKGTSASPDRIELLVLTDGNLAGMIVTNGFDVLDGHTFILPGIDVIAGDIVVLYWNTVPSKEKEERNLGKTTYYLKANSTSTLLSTNGIIVLKREIDGAVQDALVYSNRVSDEYSGFGNEKLESAVKALLELGAWEGLAVDSSLVTTSRVLARLPDAVDTNSCSDWFTTAARKSTFGDVNIYEPYED